MDLVSIRQDSLTFYLDQNYNTFCPIETSKHALSCYHVIDYRCIPNHILMHNSAPCYSANSVKKCTWMMQLCLHGGRGAELPCSDHG